VTAKPSRRELNERSFDLMRDIGSLLAEQLDVKLSAAVDRALYYSAPQAHRASTPRVTGPDETGLGPYQPIANSHKPVECGCHGSLAKFDMPIHPIERVTQSRLADGTEVDVHHFRTWTAYLPFTEGGWWG
jgi:hypothetical protein